jgi:hypothetical protein
MAILQEQNGHIVQEAGGSNDPFRRLEKRQWKRSDYPPESIFFLLPSLGKHEKRAAACYQVHCRKVVQASEQAVDDEKDDACSINACEFARDLCFAWSSISPPIVDRRQAFNP